MGSLLDIHKYNANYTETNAAHANELDRTRKFRPCPPKNNETHTTYYMNN